MLEAELAIGVMANQRQIFRQQRDGLYEGRSMAFRALDSIIHMYPITAGLTERVSAEYKQPWYVELLIELFLAVRAQHLTTNNKIISEGHITGHAARCRKVASWSGLPLHAEGRIVRGCSRSGK